MLVVLSGGLIFIALNLITATSAFWLWTSIPVMRVVFNFHVFAQYPLTIYHRAVGILLTWLIPYGFASFYPASYLLGAPVGALAWLGLPSRWRCCGSATGRGTSGCAITAGRGRRFSQLTLR